MGDRVRCTRGENCFTRVPGTRPRLVELPGVGNELSPTEADPCSFAPLQAVQHNASLWADIFVTSAGHSPDPSSPTHSEDTLHVRKSQSLPHTIELDQKLTCFPSQCLLDTTPTRSLVCSRTFSMAPS